jgi:hypothetical protein
VSPDPARNAEFSHALAQAVGRKDLFSAPRSMLKVLMGEMAAVVLASQKVSPEVLERAGFKFKFTNLEAAIVDLASIPEVPGGEVFLAEQWVPRRSEELSPFFSELKSLEIPAKWTSRVAEWRHTHQFTPMRSGTLISDRVVFKLHGGILGRAVFDGMIRNDIEAICAQRYKQIEHHFGSGFEPILNSPDR